MKQSFKPPIQDIRRAGDRFQLTPIRIPTSVRRGSIRDKHQDQRHDLDGYGAHFP